MKLWEVQRHEPLLIGHRSVAVWRWVVLAETAVAAIEIAQEEQVPKHLREEMRDYMTGEWTAEVVDGPCRSLGIVNRSPTKEEIADRDARRRVTRGGKRKP